MYNNKGKPANKKGVVEGEGNNFMPNLIIFQVCVCVCCMTID